MGALALGFGWGRSAIYEDVGWLTRATRYVTLAAPLVCCGYFAGVLYARRWLPGLLFVTAAALLVPNLYHGLDHGQRRAWLMQMLHADVQAGMPPAELGRKYAPLLYTPETPGVLGERFEMLRKARQGPYRHLAPDRTPGAAPSSRSSPQAPSAREGECPGC
jgi:hypothetical protein